MKSIEFSKLNGQGNDFILIDSFTDNVELSSMQIATMCNRHFGIGADGMILVKRSGSSDFYMDYYNQDGSKAEMCGNGIRCMSKFIHDMKLSTRDKFSIGTLAGEKIIELDLFKGYIKNIKVDMGPPIFNPEDIPVALKGGEVFDHRLNTPERDFLINCISMGNPHCIVYLEENDDIEKIPLNIWGPLLEEHSFFPNKTNVEFVKVLSDSAIIMRVWERGVGETLACGTGACAAAVSALKLEKITGPAVKVKVPGGVLNIIWKGDSSSVFLEGEAEHSFDGVYFLK
jgi:diaminopimelate epimerase